MVNHFSLVDMLDKQDSGDEADEVQLATLHASKGLEFRNVFIVGMVDGILPHENTDDVDEERRLFYVGITRAQTTLTLMVPRQIKRGGELVDVPSSRFLEELPETDVDWPTASPMTWSKRCCPTCASTADSGSSRSTTSARAYTARARATRACNE